MKPKTLLFLFIIFVLFLGIAFFPEMSSRFSFLQPTVRNELDFSFYTPEQTKSIKIKRGRSDEEINLTKEIQDWHVASYSASPTQIQAFFAALKSAVVSNLVSKNIEHQSDYGIASDSGIFITLKNGVKDTTFVIGKTGPESGSFYARIETSPNVYLVTGGLRDAIGTKVSDWRDKKILHLSNNSINSIHMTGEISLNIEKNAKGGWDVSTGSRTKHVEESTMTPFLDRLTILEGSDFLTESEQMEFTQGSHIDMTIEDTNKKQIGKLTIMKQSGPEYWVKPEGRNDILKVSSYKVSDILDLAK